MARTTPRERPPFRCTECGWTTTKWLGRCGECQAWGSLEDVSAPPSRTTTAGPVTTPAVRIGDVDSRAARPAPSGVDELDRVLGGGLVPGAVVLLAGEPGVGKSTLLLEVAARFADTATALYVTAEESTAQVRLRAARIGALRQDLFIAAETDLAAVLGHIDAVRPRLLVVDSVQTVGSGDVDGAPGNVTHVRAVAAALTQIAKERDIATILVGHVTKDGAIAGPRVLEHLVDVVLHFEGDRNSRLRMVRGIKNRYGPSDEVGCFDLSEDGITGLTDPSGLFLSRREEPVPGTCVTVVVEGKRPLVAEVQTLVALSDLTNPKRTTSGLDSGRVAMILAVLDRRARVNVRSRDVYAASVGGMRLIEPAVDLALALAVSSAQRDEPLPAGLVALGEVGLGGEIRPVPGVERRLVEAARLGFSLAVVPANTGLDPIPVPEGMTVLEVPDICLALGAVWPGWTYRPIRSIG